MLNLISFHQRLNGNLAGRNWFDAGVNMPSIFLEDSDSGRNHPGQSLPDIGPSIVDQVAAMCDRYILRAARQQKGISHDGAVVRLTVAQVL